MKIYRSQRVGKNLKKFNLLKIQTMVDNADRIGPPSTAGDDPRLTKMGKFLRKYKIDELPQVWNIIKGDMDLIGSRPEVPEVVDLMAQDEKEIIFSRKPGLMGLDTLADLHEEEALKGQKDPHQFYLDNIWPKKKRLQIYYVRNKSLWLDIKIIAQTIWKLLKRG